MNLHRLSSIGRTVLFFFCNLCFLFGRDTRLLNSDSHWIPSLTRTKQSFNYYWFTMDLSLTYIRFRNIKIRLYLVIWFWSKKARTPWAASSHLYIQFLFTYIKRWNYISANSMILLYINDLLNSPDFIFVISNGLWNSSPWYRSSRSNISTHKQCWRDIWLLLLLLSRVWIDSRKLHQYLISFGVYKYRIRFYGNLMLCQWSRIHNWNLFYQWEYNNFAGICSN